MRLVLLSLIFMVGGCSVVPLESYTVPHPSSRVKSTMRQPYMELSGVIHIHSTYSDGQLPMEEIAKIAHAQGLDYLIFTDHDTIQARRDGKEGWYGKVLVLVDEEISTAAGHYVALRLKKEVPPHHNSRQTMEEVSAQGGLGFIAHPFWRRKPWKDPEIRGVTGVEIYNAAAGALEENPLLLGIRTISLGSEFSVLSWLHRQSDALALWDKMLSRGDRIVGIGASDAHGLRRFGLRLGPYTTMFRLIRTHLLVKEVSREAIYDALQQGHAFVAHDLVADAQGFMFMALRGKSVEGIMGDQIPWRTDLELYVYVPSPGHITLFKDGHPIQNKQGQYLLFPISEPGIYRVEAARRGKPWIYSNPIYVLK